jgi:hypothetical protein
MTVVVPGALPTVVADETTPGDETKGGAGGPSCASARPRPTEAKATQKMKINTIFCNIMIITNIIAQLPESESSFRFYFRPEMLTGTIPAGVRNLKPQISPISPI